MSFLPKMNNHLLKYEGRVNRFSYQVKWNWSWHGRYSDDTEGWVVPSTGSSYNTGTYFRSQSPFIATVDYGDGTVEQHSSVTYGSSVYGNNYMYFRHYMTEIYDNDTPFSYETIPPHHYADDDKDTLRTITIEFSEDITLVCFSYAYCEDLPTLEFPELQHLTLNTDSGTKTIPMDMFSHIPNLTTLIIKYAKSADSVIPESLWTMTKLTELSITEVFTNCTDIDSSGIRNIVKLQNLTRFTSVGQVWDGTYLKEYNDLPNLEYILSAPASNTRSKTGVAYNDMPVMDEVSEINQNLTSYYYIEDYWTSYSRTAWPYHLTGYGWANITQINMYCAYNVEYDPMPEYWYEHRGATSINFYECTRSDSERVYSLIAAFYDFVTSWEYITMSSTAGDGERNQWYGMTVYWRDATSNNPNAQPEGLYLPTDGFVEGESNGNPTTSMERIYVLEKNYNQSWRTIDRPTS